MTISHALRQLLKPKPICADPLLIKLEANDPALLVPGLDCEGRGGVGKLDKSRECDLLLGVMGPGVVGIGTSCLPVILLRPLIAWPILSLRRLSAEKDFFLGICRLATDSTGDWDTSSLVGARGKAVMMSVLERDLTLAALFGEFGRVTTDWVPFAVEVDISVSFADCAVSVGTKLTMDRVLK
jgi:hypothetical protein